MALFTAENYSLLKYNTFGIDAEAARFFEYESVEDLQEIRRQISAGKVPLPVVHIGGGSNILLTGKRFSGTILHSGIRTLEILEKKEDRILIRTGSGYLWDDFVDFTVGNGWYGAENLSLIPGETGGAAVQNIGAYGAEVKDIIEEVECFDLHTGGTVLLKADECQYAYRDSILKREDHRHLAVTHVLFRLSDIPHLNLSYKALADRILETEKPDAQTIRKTVIDIRRSKLPDPSETGSAGSFFKNPVVPAETFHRLQNRWPEIPHYPVPGETDRIKLSAGWLIEKAGWKGRRLGRAGVYEKQALVLINLGGAEGSEIRHLAEEIVKSVRENFGIDLSMEVYAL